MKRQVKIIKKDKHNYTQETPSKYFPLKDFLAENL